MLYKSEELFSKDFKSGSPQGFYFLYGSENYLIDAWAKKIRDAVSGDGSAFNYQKLDGVSPDMDLLCDATEALPWGAAAKCVLLDGLDSGKMNAEQLSKYEELVSDLNPACVLVITGKEPAFDAKSSAGKKILKLAEQHGCAVALGPRSAAGQIAFLKSVAKKCGADVSADVCKQVLQVCDSDMNHLSHEMEKICAFAGGAEITAAHVEAVATPKIEARVFDLSKAILSGNTQRAFELLDNLFYLRESPVAVLSVLTMAYVDFYRARVARDEGKSAAHVAKEFGYKSEYRVQSAFSCRLSAQSLRNCLVYLFDCDLKMKSTSIDDKVLLEQAVAQLFCMQR